MNSRDRKVNIADMDGVIWERCDAWITARSDVALEAALQEYVDAILQIISFDESNASHRHDVIEQALATINTVVNHHGRDRSTFANQEVRMYSRDVFQTRLIETMMDQKNGNSIRLKNVQIDRQREDLRSTFKKVMRVDPSVVGIPLEQPALLDTNDWKRHENAEVIIQVDYRDVQERDKSLDKLRKMKESESVEIIPIYSGAYSVMILPNNLTDISTSSALASVQPFLDLLKKAEYPKIETRKNEFPPCLISCWKQKPKAE